MTRKGPRFVPSCALVEITARVVGGRYLLSPIPALTRQILGALGRSASLYPVELHAFSFMSNHWHGLISKPDVFTISRFLQRLHSMIGIAVNELFNWTGRVFNRASMAIVAPDAETHRMAYVLSQGAKEGLVASPLEWPGVHSARAMCGEEVLVGEWRDRVHEYRLHMGGGRGPGRIALESEVTKRYPIELAPLPSWARLSSAEVIDRARLMVREIEAAARKSHPHPIGAAQVTSANPFFHGDPPRKTRRSPVIHTEDVATRKAFKLKRDEFQANLLEARLRWKTGQSAKIPAACFPPALPFAPEQTEVLVQRESKVGAPEREEDLAVVVPLRQRKSS